MGRFAHSRTRTLNLGPCGCPGTPHPEGDTAEVLEELGVRDTILVSEAGLGAAAQRGGYNVAAAEAKQIELATVSWSLLDDAGQPTEPSPLWIGRLDAVTFGLLANECGKALQRAVTPLSKGRGARSATSSPASASRTPTTPTPTPPTPH